MSDWTSTDSALLLSALGSTFADVETTKKGGFGEGQSEKNPLLGAKPSNSTVNLAGVLAGLGGTSLAVKMPAEYRKAFLGAWAGMEAMLAKQNKEGGYYKGFADAMKKPIIAGALTALLAHQLPRDSELSVIPTAEKGGAITYTRKF